MPLYAKFLKEILANKRKLGDVATVALNEECSAILLNKLPQKLKDLGSFTIPCTIGNLKINKALCDLGASINLMPYLVFKKLGLGELQPTRVALQLADRSIKHPRGIIEDVLVKVGKFIFPVDFIVLDMEEDVDVPLILGQPFLATGKATVDVQQGQLSLRIQDEEVTFKMSDAMKHASSSDDLMGIKSELEYIPKIERTTRHLRREAKQRKGRSPPRVNSDIDLTTGEDPHKHLKEFHVVSSSMKP
ncbi:PREDICTED: uncharacterized protein LOC104590648 [Nelumbo nucifera]|uniref:Uncharacterized protein LOC104590648 n=1 Tax=Nelumbo nucifera TaxID=4432 RepID=A0A1U7Z9C0_NELNU|nr:PREDICTED: uncharacterized protein LOC104590648 [Nelumbo nucifera]